MRRGSLSERYVKCSKPGCLCAERSQARHGPYYSLTRTVAGRTQSRFLSAEQALIARRQVAAGRQFRRQVDAYWEACERWADAQLAALDVEAGDPPNTSSAPPKPSAGSSPGPPAAELAGRAGQPPDGTAKTRAVKRCTV
jgi:hypothetical protein